MTSTSDSGTPNSHNKSASDEAEAPVAVITGSSSGIGKATALLFARNGFRLSLSGRNEEALANALKECTKAASLAPKDFITLTVGDLREERVARQLIANTMDTFGRIDVLTNRLDFGLASAQFCPFHVNAAGILVNGGAVQTSVTELDRQMDVNVRSVVVLTKLAVPHLAQTKGTVINVSSVAGPCSFPAVTYYCMSKAALDQFTKCLALELAPKGIRVNAVNPGVIVSDIHRRAGMSEDEYNEFLERSKQNHALGRVGTADEVAKSILYLARDATFTTGHLLHIDGGRSLMTPR